MKRSIRLPRLFVAVGCALVAAALALALGVPGSASAQTSGESIDSYAVQVAIQPDGSLLVREDITYDFADNQRHGIIREIQTRSPYNDRYDRVYTVDVVSVESPDAPSQYTVENNGSSVSIRIGDPNTTISGIHEYTLNYVVGGTLSGFADHDELYWNVIGSGWAVPIHDVVVDVTAPTALTRAACYAGPVGSTAGCDSADITAGTASFTQANLDPGSALTVAVAIPKGAAAVGRPVLVERFGLRQAFALTPVSLGASGGLLAVLVILGAIVLARGRDRRYVTSAAWHVGGRRRDEAVPLRRHDQPPMQSEPPADMRPGQAGTLLDGVAGPRDVTGTIVDLAARGYLRIEDLHELPSVHPVHPDWRLVRLGNAGGLRDYEQTLLDGLFTETDEGDSTGAEGGATAEPGARSVRLSELGSAFTQTLRNVQDALYADVARQGWFTARPDLVRRRWQVIGASMVVAGAVATWAMAYARLALVPIPLILAGLALIACARWLPVRTAKGTELARRLLGFRRYITSVAARSARFTGQPEALYDYLPYAIVFGCTEEWAEMTASLTEAGRSPSWLPGIGPLGPVRAAGLSRSAYWFSSMHHFAMAANKVVSSSGGSAFSGGGGFAGGGGGGGGGGSW